MAGHNGGIGQLEVGGGDGCFMDKIKGSIMRPYYIDLNGMSPTGLPTAYTGSGRYSRQVVVPKKAVRDGNYKFWWDNTSTWSVSGGSTVTSDANSITIKPNPDNPDGSPTYILLTLTSLTVAPTFLHFVHVDDLTAFAGGEYLDIAWMNRLNYLRPGKIRYMNQASASSKSFVLDAHRTTEADISFDQEKYSHTTNKIATLVTKAVGVDDYSLTVPVWTDADMETCWFQLGPGLLSEQTDGFMRFRINGGPFLQGEIWYTSDNNYFYPAQIMKAGAGPRYPWVRVRKSNWRGSYLIRGGGTETPISGGDGGHIPYSMMAKIATRFGCHLQFSIPIMGIVPVVTGLTKTICDEVEANLGPGLIAFPEFGNEIWNQKSGFKYTFVGFHMQDFYRGNTNIDQAYGRILARGAPIVHEAFGRNKARYQLVCGIQTLGTAISATSGTPRISAQDASTAPETDVSPAGLVDEMDMTNYYNSEGRPVGTGAPATQTDPRWLNFLYWALKRVDALAAGDPVTVAKANRYMVDGCLLPKTAGASVGYSQEEVLPTIIKKSSDIFTKYGIVSSFYEGGLAGPNMTQKPAVSISGVQPDGTSITWIPAATSADPTKTPSMTQRNRDACDDLIWATKYDDKKLAWVAFRWYRRLHDTPHLRWPSRYVFIAGNEWSLGNGDGYSPMDNDAYGFAAFSNGEAIMLGSCV